MLKRPTDDPMLVLLLAREDEAIALSATDEDDRWMVGYLDLNVLRLAACSLGKVPGKNNWVEQEGGLPNYICEIARSIHRKRGKSVSQAISIAVGTVKRWARGGGDVDADTRAKAAKAVAQWEKMKASAKAKKNKD